MADPKFLENLNIPGVGALVVSDANAVKGAGISAATSVQDNDTTVPTGKAVTTELNKKQNTVTAGTGLAFGTGSASATLKAKLKSGTALAEAATNSTTSGKSYAVNVDSNGDLACNVPWTDTTYTFNTAYNASTNKAATMSDITTSAENGTLTGYEKKSGNVAAADKIVEAIGKLETKADTNENNILSLQQKTAKVYGFHVNPNESDSSAAVTYLADAVGMTPAKMGSTAFDWGSWADAFFIPKPCMVKPDGTVDYYLNPNNYAQKLDGTASELATAPTDNLLSNVSYVNNAMMEWGKIYFKYEAGQADGEWSFYVSNMNVDGTFKCWCNINANNNEIDHFYTAIYNGVGCKSKMRSVSGVKLSTTNEADTTTVAEETAAAAANNATTNPEWYTEVWSDRLLINALLYLMGKSLDLQGTYGNGISSGGQTEKQNYITGSLDDKGLFWGDTSGTTTAVKVFGMENLWACCWRRVAGCILDNNVLKVKMTYDTADGSSAHGYNLTGAGYLNFGSPASAEGWLSKITADSEKGYKPSGTQSNSSLYYKDYFYKNASIVAYLLLGAHSGNDARCGFYCNLCLAVSDVRWNVSAALSLKRWG